MKHKAKYIRSLRTGPKGWEHTEMMYEYRGHTYFVTKSNNGYMEEPLKDQHEKEQKSIDEMIERKNNPIPEWKYEGSGQEGFDLFWNYVESE